MKNVIAKLESHPAVRFGLPVLAVVGCTLLFLFGNFYLACIISIIDANVQVYTKDK